MHYVELASQPGCDRELLVKHTNLEIEFKIRGDGLKGVGNEMLILSSGRTGRFRLNAVDKFIILRIPILSRLASRPELYRLVVVMAFLICRPINSYFASSSMCSQRP